MITQATKGTTIDSPLKMMKNSWSLRRLRDQLVNLRKMSISLMPTKKTTFTVNNLLTEVARLWCSITALEEVPQLEEVIETLTSHRERTGNVSSRMEEASVGDATPMNTSKRGNLMKIVKITKKWSMAAGGAVAAEAGWTIEGEMRGAFHLKGAGDRGATIISIVVVL